MKREKKVSQGESIESKRFLQGTGRMGKREKKGRIEEKEKKKRVYGFLDPSCFDLEVTK
jgi:hypothetical protein